MQQGDAGDDILRAKVQMHRVKMFKGALAGQQLKVDVDALGRGVQPVRQQPLATVDLRQFQTIAAEVQCHALASERLFSGLILRVQATDAHRFARRPQDKFVAHRNRAR